MKKKLITIGSIILFLVGLFLAYWFFVPGKLVITTNLPGSEIFIDGEKVGAGKTEQIIKRGNHQIKTTSEGHVTYFQYVNILGWQTKGLEFNIKKFPEPVVLEKNITTLTSDENYENLLISEKSGKDFLQYDPTKNAKQLLSRVDFGQTIKTKWSPNHFLAYIWRPNGTSGLVDLKRYDLLNQEYTPWNEKAATSGVVDLAWAKNGKEVVYAYKPGDGEFSLVRATPINTKIERLYFHLNREGIKNPALEWTKDDKDLMVADDNVWVFNFYTHKLNQITKDGGIRWARLSFSGKYIVFSNDKGTFICKLDGSEMKKVDEPLKIFEWLPSGEEIVGFDAGEVRKINLQTGDIIKYGYNGRPIKKMTAIAILNGQEIIYYLSENNLVKLDLQPKTVELK